MTTPELLPNPDYIVDLCESVSTAKTQIGVTALNFASDNLTRELFAQLEQASAREVEVSVVADSHIFLELANRAFGHIPLHHPSGDETRAAYSRLRKAGASVSVVGQTNRLNPYRGRTHAKWSVADDTVYAFGGANLYAYGLSSRDFMLKYSDPKLAYSLLEQQKLIAHDHVRYPGHQETIPDGIVMLDSAIPGDSPIQRRVQELASDCEYFLYVSQYYPKGTLKNILRSKPGEFYANTGIVAPTRANKFLLNWDRQMSHISNQYSGDQYLHAKYIIFTLPDGTQTAITGSHNFNPTGVRYGTIESAVETSEPSTIAQLTEFAEHLSDFSLPQK